MQPNIATLGLRLHLGFSAKLRIWQISTCKMEPRSGTIITGPPSHLATWPPTIPAVNQTCFLHCCSVSPPKLFIKNGMEWKMCLDSRHHCLLARDLRTPLRDFLKTPLVLGQPHTLSVMIDEGHLPTGKGQRLDFFLFFFHRF